MYTPAFEIGQVLTYKDHLYPEFQCDNNNGMRKSNKTNSLLLIANHTTGLYEDEWHGNVLHYTGMGTSGDQSLDFRQNKTLAESPQTGITLLLFEVFVKSQYVYLGPVRLCAPPYQATQKGEDGADRLVWMFPLQLLTPKEVMLEETMLTNYVEKHQRKARRLTDAQLYEAANSRQQKQPKPRRVAGRQEYMRDPYIAELAKRRANGICQLCQQPAPFQTKKNEAYLESHHVIWLSNKGPDTIANTVALCPNCHRKMHILNLPEDVAVLQKVAKQTAI